MLCCVPKRLVDGSPFRDEAPTTPLSIREIQIELYPEEDALPPILLPCTICARTFMPQSLEKHRRICERAAARKRKPFNSSKQRIHGTELAEFLPKQEVRRHHDERSCAIRSSWKENHDDFLKAIREARGEIMDSRKQCNSLISSGAPTRANEKGMCPTCNRHFGIKAYDRHVAWCKERITRLPMTPATNLAKERLEARMRYRAPVLKNRRAAVREKYSSGSVNHGGKISSSPLIKPKESVSAPNFNREEPVKQKPTILRRPGQLKTSPILSGPMKSRPADRTNKPAEDHDILPVTSCPLSHCTISSRRPLHFPVPSLKTKIDDRILSNEIVSSSLPKKLCNRTDTIPQRIQNDETKNQEACSARTQRNIVSARSQGHPKLNDVTVNDTILGVTVQPCKIHKELQKEDQLITWKQISRKKNNLLVNNSVVNRDFSQEFQVLDLNRQHNEEEEIDAFKNRNTALSTTQNESTQIDGLNIKEFDKIDENDITWLGNIQNLNKTYLIKDSEDTENPEQVFHSKWKPIRHSPRVEFYFKDTKEEICELNTKESKKETKMNNETIKIAEHKTEEYKINDKDNPKKNDEIEIVKFKTEKLKTDCNNINYRRASRDKVTIVEDRIEEIKLNNENKKDAQNDIDISELNKLHREDEQLVINDISDSIIEQTEKLNTVAYERIKNPLKNITLNLSDSIKLPTYDIMHVLDASKEHQKSCTKQSEIDFANDLLSDRSIYEQHKDIITDFNENDLLFPDNFVSQDQNYNLNPKDEIARCKTNTCFDDPLYLKESTITFICDQHEKINSTFFNSSNDYNLCPENEMLQCQNNICHNSLDLEENIKRSSFPTSYRSNSEMSIIEDGKRIEINEDRRADDSITFQNEQSEKCMNELNYEIFPSLNSEIAGNYSNVCTNNSISQIDADKHREEYFNSDNSTNNNRNSKDDKKDSITILDNDSNNRTEIPICSTTETDSTANENLREIRNKNIDNEINCDSNIIVENNAQGDNKLKSSIMLKNDIGGLYNETSFVKEDINFPERSSSSIIEAIREHPANSVEIKQKIRERMNFLRDSTDSLVSSVEFVELSSIRRPKIGSAYNKETIEIIRPSKRSKLLKDLPDIKGESKETRENSKRPVNQTYWERASKISRSRLISLDLSHRMAYRLSKRNPRIHILPPVPSPSLINRRKVELMMRPPWCNYVRSRPDFNLVLKARTGTCKDYDPFLLAEQQMKDLLSDTSDQSMTDSPKPQTRDRLYPLSHSSAFVKYPCQTNLTDPDKRSSLIAPPSEFDDLTSDFSSDSTETNSISREVFLKDLCKNTMDASGPKPIRELGRRLIIDKTRALGSDLMEERRGGSADRPRNSLDRVATKATRPLDRSASIRASSAPKTNSDSDRRISGDTKKAAPKSTEDQRSSDRSLNQRNNNNYSSLSGSNLSLSSIVSSEMDIKRSNSMFDELMTSLGEDIAYPGLRSFLNNESFDMSSSMHRDRQRNGLVSDEELSSPDSYKPQDHSKLSNDSAYSSLNRKYSHHGRSTNDVACRFNEDAPRNEASSQTTKCKMSKFCHECGQRFPENAKFCCECGIRRLAL